MSEVMFLKKDVVGPYSVKLFGQRGDQVLIVSNHDDVMIVEKADVRFTVRTEFLSPDPIENDTEARTVQMSTAPKTKKRPSKRKSITNKLFL